MEDQETGELTVFDHETGEILHRNVQPLQHFHPETDAETGEPETKASCNKHHFHVPKTLYNKGRPRLGTDTLHPAYRRSNSKTVCCIEEKMVSGSQNMSPIVFMLPTLFLFPAWASVLCVFFECCIHAWAHKRNKLFPDTVPQKYKSPLHIITSEFCAKCRSEKLMQRIGKLQDERKLQIDNRKLRAYMEKVSSIVT